MSGVSIIIPAAGIGSRMNFPMAKQFFVLEGMPVLLHLLKRVGMVEDIDEVIVALRENEVEEFNENVLKEAGLDKSVKTVIGGATRQESVANALKELSADSEVVMVHDAVRPLVTPNILQSAIDTTRELGATVAAVATKDTIKEVKDGVVVRTLDRSSLYWFRPRDLLILLQK
ncbi:2-C-methyl-D-erythritol 4-phosphate cytidylyltransferase, partial [Thermodesulfobacteriota bacterium]